MSKYVNKTLKSQNSELCSVSNVHISISINDKCELSQWGLPPKIYEKYEKNGVTKMFPWQVECLANSKILEENKNLVYSAPTSAGKTLVSEILILKTILEQKKKALFILPFVSVVREKMFYFQDLLSDSGIRVEGFMGSVSPIRDFSSVNIAIATIEKANSLINRLTEEEELTSLGIVVIDELHLLGDPGRGYLLELLLTKLKYATLKMQGVQIQFVGMSATLPNLPSLAKWLNAELYKTDFRPIPLAEYCKIGNTLYDNQFCPLRNLPTISEVTEDVDNVFQLCLETVQDGHGILIFCPSKNWCEKLALQIAKVFAKLGHSSSSYGTILREKLDTSLIKETLEQLKRCPVGLDGILKSTVSFGVAYHHAGLTMDERDIIEGAFRIGSLKVLTATSTLSSGVNLPARRVIIRSPLFNGHVLDTLVYKEMIGRAGRMGKDTAGESILICKPSEKFAAESLLSASLNAIESCLDGSGCLLRTLLEAIASRVVRTIDDLKLYLGCTFAVACDENNLKDCVSDAIKFLTMNEFIILKKTDDEDAPIFLEATPLGKACLSAAISPRDGLYLFEELQKARRCIALDTELHILYLVTPYDSGSQINQIDWINYMDLWRSLEDSERRVGYLIGVEESFLISAIKGKVHIGKKLNVHRRFYTALALYELIHEVPLGVVCKKYNCCRGLLQSLQQSSATLAGMVTQFCKELGWSCMEVLVSQFQARLQFGVCRDLLDLLRLPSLNGIRARSLYKEGIKTVTDLASADECDVERALNKAIPFESAKDNIEDEEYNEDVAKKRKMKTIFITGRDGLTAQQAAGILINEARDIIQNSLGVKDVKWQSQDLTTSVKVDDSTILKSKNLIEYSQSTILSPKKMHSMHNKSNCVQHSKLNNHSRISDHFLSPNKSLNKKESIEIEREIQNGVYMKNDVILRSNTSQTPKEKVHISCEIPRIIIETGIEELKLSTKFETELQVESELPSEFLNTLNEPNELFQKNKTDILDKTNKMSKTTDNISKSKLLDFSKNKENVDMISFGTPWYNDEISDTNKMKQNEENIDVNMKNNNLDEKLPSSDLNKFSKIVYELSSEDMFIHLQDASIKDKFQSSSFFGDSFMDVAMCEMLEQNVFDSASEKCSVSSSFNTDEIKTNGYHYYNKKQKLSNDNCPSNLTKETNKTITSVTWIDISWSSLKSVESLKDRKNIDVFNNNILHSKAKPVTVSNQDIEKDNFKENSKIIKLVDHNNMKFKIQPAENIKQNTKSELETFSNENKNKKMQTSKRKLSDATNTINDNSITIMSFDTWENDAKKPRISLNDQENVYRDSLEISKQSKTLKRDKSKICSEFDNICPNDFLNKNSLKSTTKRKSSIEVSDNDDIISTSQSYSKVSENPFSSCSKKEIATSGKKRNMSGMKMKVASKSKNMKISQIKNTLKDSKSTLYQPPESYIQSCESPSTTVVNRKSIYTKSDEEITEEDFNFQIISVIRLESSKSAFKLFKRDIEEQTEISMALACDSCEAVNNIGFKILGGENNERSRSRRSGTYMYEDKRLCGVAISWGLSAIYFMSLVKSADDKVSIRDRMNILKKILESSTIKVRCFATKEVYKALYQYIEIAPLCDFIDPKVACWLLNPDAVEKSFKTVAMEYFPKGKHILEECDTSYGTTSPGLNTTSQFSAYKRSVGEALLTWYIMESLIKQLKKKNPIVLKTFEDIEMKIVTILARVELRGFGLNSIALRELAIIMQNEMKILEDQAYTLAGRSFKFCSPKEVSQVLDLPKKGKISTGRAVLEKCNNPIANLIISWRKLNTTENKIIIPFLNMLDNDSRIRGNYITCTLTGRMSMHEPNIQNVPKDFMSFDESKIFSLRTAFIPNANNIFISADYCQLELRIMAHFSKDDVLSNAVCEETEDIFKSIAAAWNNVSIDQVNQEMRNRTKQLCYGMIYGMGTKTLAETLKVTEIESTKFLENFMSTFKGVRRWLGNVVKKAQTKGYVTTLMGRRRTLPALFSENQSERSQAERQAVNTKVQGSAADIVKKAMVLIEQRMRKTFPEADIVFPALRDSRNLRSAVTHCRGGYLILQLHDELIYEVRLEDLKTSANIIKDSMENVCTLDVPLPVKIKIGTTWGDLKEYNEF